MSSLSLRLPDSLHRHIKEFSEKEGVSINQFISTAVAEKMSALSTQTYLEERGKRGSKAKLKKLLKKVPAIEPEEHDRMK
ncbi:toxin-antitoxin system HicB family antitoxin [Pelagicoccus sp. SDUM812003]|uniref:toxin-antitoxin system HicB family antitoxin n=1 Tax=Pelagicoccus sp. SDUM812003 TaxID=3041267 RepID=UPI00280FBAA1|nr:toxin-antitoxin system HicB family antitoxin [Pelagicoccus sp. SDUM812003]MDQ8205824.1 toxin-antitoxin system HicB family antitoxin [Pelagicoccus sp. SDUM812003]